MAKEYNLLHMSVPERKLFTSVREFVDRACPDLEDGKRMHVIATIYDMMHFVTKMPENA